MEIHRKKFLAREILIILTVIIYMLVVYFIIQSIFDGSYKIKFDIWNKELPEQDYAINTLILFGPVIILYLMRPIFLLVKWCVKTLNIK